MKRLHIIMIISLTILLVFFLIYLGISIQISSMVNEMMQENYNSYGKTLSEKYSDFISIDDYTKISYRRDDSNITNEINKTEFPCTIWWWNKATVYYKYSYVVYDETGDLICADGGSMSTPITLEFSLIYEKGNWRVTNVYVPL